jgi:protein involved in polysaccharide export with SLBB domain
MFHVLNEQILYVKVNLFLLKKKIFFFNQFLYLASSVIQSELEKNIAESERSILNDKNMVRLPRQARTQTVAVSATTKKPSSFNFDSISNIINNGLTAAGHISNAIGSYYSKIFNKSYDKTHSLFI